MLEVLLLTIIFFLLATEWPQTMALLMLGALFWYLFARRRHRA